MLIGFGLLGLVYVILSSGLSLGSIKALVIALSHSYALVFAIWLLGHGLVNVPRTMWTEADPRSRLNSLYRHATRVSDAYAEAQSNYADVAAEIKSLGRYKDDSEYLEWIDELLDEVEEDDSSLSQRGVNRVTIDRAMINDEYLSTLTRRLRKCKIRFIRHETDWQKLLKDCARAEDIINARGEGTLVFRYGKTMFPAPMAYFYYTKVSTNLTRAFAIILAAVSICLVWSEATHGTKLSIVDLVVSSTYGVAQQFVSSLILGFMCVAMFASLTRIRIFNVYALVHRSSDMSSLLFYSMYACRLTVPLSYNYLNLISSRDSVFEEFLGKSINLTPLGKYFNDWLPRLVIVPVLFTLFHFYDKIKNFLGFGLSFDDEGEEDEDGNLGSAIEGRELVSRALTDPRSRFAISIPGSSPRVNSPVPPEARRFATRQYHTPINFRDSQELVRDNNNQLGNIKSFFGNVGQKIQQGISRIPIGRDDNNDRHSLLPRWSRLGNDDNDQTTTIL